MAMISTLPLPNEETLSTMFSLWASSYDEAQKDDIKDFDSPSAVTTSLMPPLVLLGVDFVLRLTQSPEIQHTYIGRSDYGAPHRENGIAPVDGETQWYCSECKDGPYLAWQVSCQNCQHPKCSSCSSEKK